MLWLRSLGHPPLLNSTVSLSRCTHGVRSRPVRSWLLALLRATVAAPTSPSEAASPESPSTWAQRPPHLRSSSSSMAFIPLLTWDCAGSLVLGGYQGRQIRTGDSIDIDPASAKDPEATSNVELPERSRITQHLKDDWEVYVLAGYFVSIAWVSAARLTLLLMKTA
jgi:hypothetical protein